MPSPGNELAGREAFSSYVRLLGYARAAWRGWLAIVLVTVASTAFGLARPWPLKLLTDNVLGDSRAALSFLPGSDRAVILAAWVALASLLIFGIGAAIDVVAARLWVKVGQGMVYKLAGDLFDAIMRRSIVFHTKSSVGDSMARIGDDSWAVHDVADTLLLAPLHAVLMVTGMVVVMVRIDPRLTIAAIAAAPLSAVAAVLLGRPVRNASRARRLAESDIYSNVQQTLAGIPVVQAFAREHHHDARFRASTTAALRAQQRTILVRNLNMLATGGVTTIGAGLVLYIGARHVLAGRLTVGSLLVFTAYLTSLQGELKSLPGIYTTLQAARGSVERVIDILDTPPEVAEAPDAAPLPAVRGEIRFDRVSFSYGPERTILDDVSFTVRPGERIGIVGATGAGKSTLVSLALRLIDPSDGSVSIDGNDLRAVTLASVRDQVALVSQEAVLFPTTLAENIAYGRPGASSADILEAAAAANCDRFIRALPDGFETVVGERGATLSGGERQRIAIARALLRDAPILLLDEPTSALDAGSEEAIMVALERLMWQRTTLIIAHRLSTVRDANRIVVMDKGRVVEVGTHPQLMRLGGAYRALYDSQAPRALAEVGAT